MSYDLGTAHGRIDLDYEGGRAAAQADDDIDRIRDSSDNADKAVAKFGKTLSSFASFMGKAAKSAAVGALAITSLVHGVQLVAGAIAVLAPLAAATFAALPGLILAGMSAMAVFKASISGVGEALKLAGGDAAKFEEAVAKLSPQAGAFARAFRAATEALKPMQQAMQNAFFNNTSGEVGKITKGILSLRKEAVGAADGFNQVFRRVLEFGSSTSFIEAVRSSLVGVRAFLLNIDGAIKPLLTAFANLAKQAGAFGGDLGNSVAGGMTKLAEAMNSVDLAATFEKAMVVLRPLGEILKNVGSIISSVFGGLTTDAGGALGVIGELTGKLAEFLKSAEGQEALKALGQALATISGEAGKVFLTLLQELAPVIVALAPALGELAKQASAVLVPALQAVGPLLQGLAGFISDNLPLVESLAAAVGVLVLAHKAHEAILAAGGLLKFLKAIKLVQVATTTWTGIQWLLNIALTANPIGLIIVAVAALIAVIILIATKTTWFQDLWKVVWTFIKDAAKSVADWFMNTIVPFFKTAWDGIVAAFQSAWDTIKGVLDFFVAGFNFWWDAIKAVLGFFSGIFKAAFDLVVSIVQTAWAIISALFEVWKTVMAAIWQPILDAVVAVFKWAWEAITGVITAFVDWVSPYLTAAWDAITGAISAAWDAIKNAATAAWDFIKGVFLAFWNWVKPYVQAAIDAIKTVLSTAWEFIKTAATTVWNAIKTVFSTVWEAIKSIVRKAVDSVIAVFNGIKTIVDKVKGFFNELKKAASGGTDSLLAFVKGIPGRVISAIGNLGSLLYNKGRDLVQGMIDGIRNMFGSVGNVASDLVSMVTDFLPGSPAKKGPLSGKGWTPHRGASLVEGLSEGMGQAMGKLQKMSLKIATVAAPVLPTAVGGAGLRPGTVPMTMPTLRPAAAAAEPAVHIGSLTVAVQGVLDMADPQAARQIATKVNEAIENLKKGYK